MKCHLPVDMCASTDTEVLLCNLPAYPKLRKHHFQNAPTTTSWNACTCYYDLATLTHKPAFHLGTRPVFLKLSARKGLFCLNFFSVSSPPQSDAFIKYNKKELLES